MLQTENRVTIAAPPEFVFSLAADVLAWPRMLPHYRYVRLVSGDSAPRSGERVITMSARRSGIPITWTAQQRLRPEDGVIEYRHLAGLSRGMEVRWTVTEVGQETEVVIDHVLEGGGWWMRLPLATWVAGDVFVRSIADRTLSGVKREAEALTRGAAT